MGIKEFLKPSKRKVLFSMLSSFLLIVMFILILKYVIFIPFFSYLVFPMMILFFEIPLLTGIIILIFILLSYPLNCYVISRNKKLSRWMIVYLVIFIMVSVGAYFIIESYNVLFGYSCNTYSDCHSVCGAGAVNYNYIPLSSEKNLACMKGFAVCENHRCVASPYEPCDIDRDEDCDRDDYEQIMQVIGQCEDGEGYNELADADHDGCVTERDRKILFPTILEK